LRFDKETRRFGVPAYEVELELPGQTPATPGESVEYGELPDAGTVARGAWAEWRCGACTVCYDEEIGKYKAAAADMETTSHSRAEPSRRSSPGVGHARSPGV
jgi:hypothetical protein